jgi:hypothetical protein
MEKAVCIRCGLLKDKTFVRCPRCDLDPKSDDETMAKSIRLSTRYQTSDGEFLTPPALNAVSKLIEAGTHFSFERGEIDALLEEKRLLDQGLSFGDKAKIALFLLALMIPATIGLLVILL